MAYADPSDLDLDPSYSLISGGHDRTKAASSLRPHLLVSTARGKVTLPQH